MAGNLTRLFALGIRYPVMQAGMPEMADPELVAAVARAGGIGTLGLQDISVWDARLRETRALAPGLPFAANLLLPYTRRKHVDLLLRHGVPIVTLFWGRAKPYVRALQRGGAFVFQQVGSATEAAIAVDAGVDGLIAQGTEAGGHVRGRQPLGELLPELVARHPEVPVFAAGGQYTADDVKRSVALGAAGVSTGTRFLLTYESKAHVLCKQRLLTAQETLVTTLFGLGWPTPHRVLPNAATARWCGPDGSVPNWLHAFNASFAITRKLVPFGSGPAALQRPQVPVFSPAGFTVELPDSQLECTALYAGEHVGRITSLMRAEDVVRELARGLE